MYVISEKEYRELLSHELLPEQINEFLSDKQQIEKVAVSSLYLKDGAMDLHISPENYVKDCNYYKIYVEHFIE